MGHFYSSLPESIAVLSDREAVDRYAQGAGVPGEAIEGLTADQLNAFPVPGTWSIQQIVVHLMDTDLIAAYRMKRIVAEDRPALDLYDEVAFSKRLHYERLDAARVCEVFRLNRLNVADMLRAVPAAAFAREAIHQENGAMTLGLFLRLYVHHLDHHMRFLREKRSLVESKIVAQSAS